MNNKKLFYIVWLFWSNTKGAVHVQERAPTQGLHHSFMNQYRS